MPVRKHHERRRTPSFFCSQKWSFSLSRISFLLHTDPHPGNIFVLDSGEIGLIDFGQVKQISGRNRETLAKVMIALDERVGDDRPEDLDDAKDEAAAAVGMWLFDGSTQKLPGGYDLGELSPNSPVKELKSFPQDLVLVGRSSILIKGLSSRLDIPWSLSKEWAPIARQVLERGKMPAPKQGSDSSDSQRIRFVIVLKTLKQWAKGRSTRALTRLPSPVRSRVAAWVVRREERKSRKALRTRPTFKE
jgi:predicted unusual protein kinase regulating ubiquinone biosynthesis (AarF/ABC1/UbiB family)